MISGIGPNTVSLTGVCVRGRAFSSRKGRQAPRTLYVENRGWASSSSLRISLFPPSFPFLSSASTCATRSSPFFSGLPFDLCSPPPDLTARSYVFFSSHHRPGASFFCRTTNNSLFCSGGERNPPAQAFFCCAGRPSPFPPPAKVGGVSFFYDDIGLRFPFPMASCFLAPPGPTLKGARTCPFPCTSGSCSIFFPTRRSESFFFFQAGLQPLRCP